jgi:hypothetical protein
VKRVAAALAACACAVASGAAAPAGRAAACGLPDAHPYWIDYAGHDAPIAWKPGLVLAVSSGTETPAKMRAAGAATIFFDLNFNRRVGTPTAPADPATIPDRARRLFDFAVSVTGCATPLIALNELFGAQTPTPWSDTNAQYRGNVLALLQELKKLGAQPAITIANPPYTGGEAADWWRAAADAALLVRQVYFTSPNSRGLYKLGPVRASRVLRQGMRGLVRHLTEIGIPPQRIALELQFQSVLGQGGREGLTPRSAWLEVVKLEALAAKQVARETGIDSVWSWGWATFSAAGQDPDKTAAACVWIWARDQRLCDAPTMVRHTFDESLTEGQLILPRNTRCTFDGGRARILRTDTARLAALTGDVDLAASALLERLVLRDAVPSDPVSVLAAERGIVLGRFGGSRARYATGLRRSQLTLLDGRALIADRLARDAVEARFKPRPPPQRQVDDFLATYADQPVRLVESDPAAPWLGDAVRGWAVATLTPSRLFTLPVGKSVFVDTPDERFAVRALGPPLPLGLLPRPRAEAAARAALRRVAKQDVYRSWVKAREAALLADAICVRDQLPSGGPVDLGPFVPFLAD